MGESGHCHLETKPLKKYFQPQVCDSMHLKWEIGRMQKREQIQKIKKKYIYSLHNTDMALQAKAFSYTFVTPYPRVSRAVWGRQGMNHHPHHIIPKVAMICQESPSQYSKAGNRAQDQQGAAS